MSSKSRQCRHPINGNPNKARDRRRRRAMRGTGQRPQKNPIKQSLRNEIAARKLHNAKHPHAKVKTSVRKVKPEIKDLYYTHGKVAVAPGRTP